MPFARFPGVDTILGPEMRSTGEVMGLDTNFGRAFAKSQIGAGPQLPLGGTVFISVKDADKDLVVAPARDLVAMGFSTDRHPRHRARACEAAGLPVATINKVLEGRPHVVDALKNGEIHLVFNTTEGAQALADSLLDPPHRADPEGALLHHHGGGDGGHRGDRGAASGLP